MNKTPQELQELHEALQASKVAKHLFKIHWPHASRMSLESPTAVSDKHIFIDIEADKEDRDRFIYGVLVHNPYEGHKAYEVLKKKNSATTEEIIEEVAHFFTPEITKQEVYKFVPKLH